MAKAKAYIDREIAISQIKEVVGWVWDRGNVPLSVLKGHWANSHVSFTTNGCKKIPTSAIWLTKLREYTRWDSMPLRLGSIKTIWKTLAPCP
jgi:hypothetical protein